LFKFHLCLTVKQVIRKQGNCGKKKEKIIKDDRGGNMRRAFVHVSSGIIMLGVFFFAIVYNAQSGTVDWLKSQVATATSTTTSAKLSDTKVGTGLKEALKVGIENTIKLLGREDGYLGNQAVKILLPQGIKNAEPVLRKAGLGPKIDEFVLSMNRAAEKAAPLAANIFASAITEMSIDDANKVLNGGNTAATEYLKGKTYTKLLETFQPKVRTAMDDYAVTKKYQEIADKTQTLPLINKFAANVDINKYVSSKALDGLFNVLGQQEANIRTNPAARVTDLLKQVFSK
jgi:hypothetical protein